MLIKNSWTAVGIILLVTAVSAVGAACLPDSPYQRFQLLPAFYGHIAWIYERIHYDPRPIDVVIVGPSKTFTGVSGGELEKRLSILGKPASVANLSLVYQGRNAQWAILDELYKVKSPRILIVQIDEEVALWGHPWFMYFAPAMAIAFPPSMLLHNYLPDLSFLPYRQMELFAATFFPNFFGSRRALDPIQYAETRTDFTTNFRGSSGELVDMESEIPAAELRAEHEEFKKTLHTPRLPRALSTIVEADDRIYLDKIAQLAFARGTRLMLLYIPDFEGDELDEKARNSVRQIRNDT